MLLLEAWRNARRTPPAPKPYLSDSQGDRQTPEIGERHNVSESRDTLTKGPCLRSGTNGCTRLVLSRAVIYEIQVRLSRHLKDNEAMSGIQFVTDEKGR